MTIIKTMEELGRAIDAGEKLEWMFARSWGDLDVAAFTLSQIMRQVTECGAVRIAPKMTFIEGPGGRFEYPEPISDPVGYHDVFVISLHNMRIYTVYDVTASVVKTKRVHTTKEAAEQHLTAYRKAMGIKS